MRLNLVRGSYWQQHRGASETRGHPTTPLPAPRGVYRAPPRSTFPRAALRCVSWTKGHRDTPSGQPLGSLIVFAAIVTVRADAYQQHNYYHLPCIPLLGSPTRGARVWVYSLGLLLYKNVATVAFFPVQLRNTHPVWAFFPGWLGARCTVRYGAAVALFLVRLRCISPV